MAANVSPLQVVVDNDYFDSSKPSRTVTQANRHTALINSGYSCHFIAAVRL
jgi:hypothetical protein